MTVSERVVETFLLYDKLCIENGGELEDAVKRRGEQEGGRPRAREEGTWKGREDEYTPLIGPYRSTMAMSEDGAHLSHCRHRSIRSERAIDKGNALKAAGKGGGGLEVGWYSKFDHR
ncbi:hypothetical protein B0H13DRAFT_1863023 [Mycena leptocephala]|nr:hypothetical protein B0H13DRAFT_1863023 [Mycena leptocephala]